MPRKRKRDKRRWLTMYKLFGIHALLFIVSLIILAIAGPINSGEFGAPILGFLELFMFWTYAFYLHLGLVVVMTLYRLLRQLLYIQPQQDRQRDEKLERLLREVVELRQDLRQRGIISQNAPFETEIQSERLVDSPREPSGEWDLIGESRTDAESHGGEPQRY